MRRQVVALVAVALSAALSGCVGAPTAPEISQTAAPIGPVPAPDGPLTLDAITGIVTDDDTSDTTTFTPDGTLTTSGADQASEADYWIAVGGRPDTCAGVVSAPYLVSSADSGDRLDDPSMLFGTITEIDEERFGLIQIYARQFDDAATAQSFLAELTATVQACPSYQLVDGDTVTWNAVALSVTPLANPPAGVTGLRYAESLQDSAAIAVSTVFLQRDGVVISVYGEITTSSTITQQQVDDLAAAVEMRLGEL